MLLQEDIEQFRDNPLPESQDFKMAMAQMYGMVRTDIEALETKLETIKTMMSDAGLQQSRCLTTCTLNTHQRETSLSSAYVLN